MPRRFTRTDNWDFGGKPAPGDEETGEPKSRKRRLATTFVFTTLFFAGASLAAVAGDRWSASIDTSDSAALEATATTEDAASDAAPAEPAAEESAPSADDAMAAAAAEGAATHELTESADSAQELAPEAGSDQGWTTADAATAASSGAATRATAAAPRPKLTRAKQIRVRTAHLRAVLLPKTKPAPEPEIEGPENSATIWLNSPLPDPTPPAVRLSPKFAAGLKSAARGSGVDWAVMLGILRARGASGHNPADRVTLNRLAARLGTFGPTKGDWARIVSYSGDMHFADKAAALARYNRAVGLNALVRGLEAAKPSIATRLLADPQVSIYAGGRNDIVQDKVDVRVLATIAYLRESFGQVTVSSLISGHRLYARPGVISAHIPGHAVDIAALGDTPIQGHQAPGGITERAVRDLLFAPAEIMPRQIISLLGLGGPSFPLDDHYNHIHIGF
jgi:hypothetical protein